MKNKTVKFTKQYLIDELGLPYDGFDACEIIRDDVIDTDRWAIQHRLVFKHKEVFYETYYSVGATEMQDERPWEWDDTVDCTVVVPTEVTKIEYKPVKGE